MTKSKAISAMYVEEGAQAKGKIGVLVFFTMGEVAVPIEAMETYWQKNKLPERWKPRIPDGYNAFMRTCSGDNTAIWEEMDDKEAREFEETMGLKEGSVKTAYLTVRVAGRNDEYILIRRVWLQDGEKEIKPTHPNLARLTYQPEEDRIDVVPFPEYDDKKLVKKIKAIANEHYQWEKSIINGPRHRTMLRELMGEMGGVPFMGKDGSWFLPARGEEPLDRLEGYIDEVVMTYKLTGHSTRIMTIDAVDSEKMRNQIAEDVATEVQARWEELNSDIVSLLTRSSEDDSDARKQTLARKLEAKLAEAEALGLKMEMYEQMLERRVKMNLQAIKSPRPLKGRTKALVDAINQGRR
jgi:hypothetical protein